MSNTDAVEKVEEKLPADKTAEVTTVVEFSSNESSVLGMKIGRCNSNYFNENELYRQIVEGGYDLCRLKVSAEDEYAPLRLNRTGLPAFFSGSIRRYKTKITEPPPGNYNHPDLVWEPYDGTQNQLLRDMLVGTWGDYPLGYYRSPYTTSLLDKEKEIEAVFQFYKKQNNPNVNPGNGFVFIKHGAQYVGFFALNSINGNLESHVGGILAPYRKGGYFLDKLRYIKEFCLKNKLEHFIFGARNENAEVQRIFQHVGFQPTGSENVFHIPSMLTCSALPVVMKEITPGDDIHLQLLDESLALSAGIFPAQRSVSFQINHLEILKKGEKHQIRFSFPVVNEKELLMVLRSASNEFAPYTGYLRLTT